MPEKKTLEAARRDKREGKSGSTQAGEFVREEMHHIREGRHGARSARQAIAIGLSQARRAGVNVPKAPRGSESARKSTDHPVRHKPSATRSRATLAALKREGHAAASHAALSRQAHSAASQRSAADRSASARKAAKTKGPQGRSEAAHKAARTRAAHVR